MGAGFALGVCFLCVDGKLALLLGFMGLGANRCCRGLELCGGVLRRAVNVPFVGDFGSSYDGFGSQGVAVSRFCICWSCFYELLICGNRRIFV